MSTFLDAHASPGCSQPGRGGRQSRMNSEMCLRPANQKADKGSTLALGSRVHTFNRHETVTESSNGTVYSVGRWALLASLLPR